MLCDGSPEAQSSAACYVYRPGDARQDIYTIPLEILGVLAVSSLPPPQEPRWPFAHESANEENNPTRHPGTFAFGMATALAVPLTSLVLRDHPQFLVWSYARGAIHAHLWTEFFTSSAKNYFGRKRPFFDAAQRRGGAVTDDHRSFFSGHAAHSFAFATYSTQLAFDQIKEKSVAWIFAGLLNGTALWVGASRAIDHQHNWSDVLTGAIVGSSLGYLTYQRVRDVHQESFRVSLTPGGVSATVFLK